jgi:hypothetical protein
VTDYLEDQDFLAALARQFAAPEPKGMPDVQGIADVKWYFRQVVRINGNPNNPMESAKAVATFYNHHEEKSETLAEFLKKCDLAERGALRGLGYRTDDKLKAAGEAINRRSFIRNTAAFAALAGFGTGVVAAGRAMDDRLSVNPVPKSQETMHETVAIGAAIAAALGTLLLIKESSDANRIRSEAETAFEKEKRYDAMVSKLLTNTQVILKIAFDEQQRMASAPSV